jgi:hypothetical protein
LPNIKGKPVFNIDFLRAILVFNIAFDNGIFPFERYRIGLFGCYMILCYIKARPAELVDNERRRPKNGFFEELFGAKAVISAEQGGDEIKGDEKAFDADFGEICKLLLRETFGRDRPKALYFEDILLMIVRDFVIGRFISAISIKFIHYKKCDNKPKSYV